MKKVLGVSAMLLILLVAGFTAAAQKTAPRWVSAKGYWMVESNIHQPRHSCVYFYNNENTLVHKETIDGKKLSINRKRTKMKLKTALEIAVDAWAAGRSPDTSHQYIAALLTK